MLKPLTQFLLGEITFTMFVGQTTWHVFLLRFRCLCPNHLFEELNKNHTCCIWLLKLLFIMLPKFFLRSPTSNFRLMNYHKLAGIMFKSRFPILWQLNLPLRHTPFQDGFLHLPTFPSHLSICWFPRQPFLITYYSRWELFHTHPMTCHCLVYSIWISPSLLRINPHVFSWNSSHGPMARDWAVRLNPICAILQ